jgi:hypothetical protein
MLNYFLLHHPIIILVHDAQKLDPSLFLFHASLAAAEANARRPQMTVQKADDSIHGAEEMIGRDDASV